MSNINSVKYLNKEGLDTSEKSPEDLLTLSDGEYLQSIEKARKQIKSGDTFMHNEVFGKQ